MWKRRQRCIMLLIFPVAALRNLADDRLEARLQIEAANDSTTRCASCVKCSSRVTRFTAPGASRNDLSATQERR